MTQNVWFDPSNKEQRFLMLIELIEREAPHVVALQEMTLDAANWLMASDYIRATYWITDPDIVTLKNWYGVLTLVSRKLSPNCQHLWAAYYDYGVLSTLGRGLLTVAFDVCRGQHDTVRIVVGNTHLESPVKGVFPKHRFD